VSSRQRVMGACLYPRNKSAPSYSHRCFGPESHQMGFPSPPNRTITPRPPARDIFSAPAVGGVECGRRTGAWGGLYLSRMPPPQRREWADSRGDKRSKKLPLQGGIGGKEPPASVLRYSQWWCRRSLEASSTIDPLPVARNLTYNHPQWLQQSDASRPRSPRSQVPVPRPCWGQTPSFAPSARGAALEPSPTELKIWRATLAAPRHSRSMLCRPPRPCTSIGPRASHRRTRCG